VFEPSRMAIETAEAPAVCERLLAQEAAHFAALGRLLRDTPPQALLTMGRGSSYHAAQFFAYLVMVRLGRLVSSLPMSVLTLHGSPLQTAGLWAVAFSQSGQSPDLVASLQTLQCGGAQTVALVNDVGSPLARACGLAIALHAGPELSVAATKTCLAQFVAGAALVAGWQGDAGFSAALHQLPAQLQRALGLDWSAAVEQLQGADRLFVVGRGTGLAVATEVALKFKEVCGIQAEPFSGAELQHGPMALVQPGFPVLLLAPPGPAQSGLLALAPALRERGAQVLLAAPPGTPDMDLPLAVGNSAELDAIAMLQSAYPMLEALARRRGRDPDRPPHLQKVTRTA